MVLRTGRDRCGGSRIGCMGAVGDENLIQRKDGLTPIEPAHQMINSPLILNSQPGGIAKF